ncbi:stage II sporulation protein E [Aeribacillus pallidus]|uniref:stage II sporulation protein E n=1 Tax=Aeribacillus pallidus TaxID=33936 RepID=UPI003D1EF00A
MAKMERSLVEPLNEVNVAQTKVQLAEWGKWFWLKLGNVLIQRGLVFILIGFLLGRALILSHLTPFVLPFFASMYMLRRDKSPFALIGLLAGSLTISFTNMVYVFISTTLFLIIFKITESWRKDHLRSLPFLVFFVTTGTKLSFAYIESSRQLTLYDGMMTGVEASLSFILTLIFLQCLPLFTPTKRKKILKTEEIVCVIIMLASVLTGTIGWSIYDLSIEHILSRYLVLVFAFIAGATLGSTVGVVTGLIFSLANVSSFYQMSLLAFAGLLGGLLKEGNKLGAASGLFIATLLIGMYGEMDGVLTQTLYESALAVVLFFLTPKLFMETVAKYIPGTQEYALEQQQYMRKIRDVTAQRVSQFSNVFQALSKSFSQYDHDQREEQEEREFDFFLSNVTEKTCQTCFRKEQCWVKNFNTTYDLMREIMYEIDEGKGTLSHRTQRELDKHCTRSKKVIKAIEQEITYFKANQKLKKQVQESRKLVAEQLLGVSIVMEDFAKEIQKERENMQRQEEMIFEALEDFGVQVEQVDIYSLEQGNVDIDMMIPYCQGHGEGEKLIAPMLSDILGETIIVHKEECASFPNGFCHVTFRSAKKFVVETGVAHAAKGGGLVSGDSYSMIELDVGKFAIAISDGMGNGERAHHESNETLRLLQYILKSGIDEKLAIKSVNSILSLRTTDEVFSTLDLAMIDLQDAKVNFLKVGSTPSFIKRGDKVMKVEAGNLPMGILQDMEVDTVSEQLKSGDLLIMMSDGIFEGPKHVENYELWMRRKIRELETNNPQEIADLIMEEVIRTKEGDIDDDMTIVVAQVKHNIPKWATIPLTAFSKKKRIS